MVSKWSRSSQMIQDMAGIRYVISLHLGISPSARVIAVIVGLQKFWRLPRLLRCFSLLRLRNMTHLSTICEGFLAPPSIPPARRQYDVTSAADMSELSVRFMGSGSDRLRHTLGISQGLMAPASKFKLPRVPPLNFPQGRWKES
jgi:hypothetical protein